ncbi:MAG: outer membrane protein assembly factor BamE [Paracoccaceae bacterium]
MAGHRGVIRWIATGMVLLALAACSAVYRNHGYVPTDAELEKIEVGRDTRDSVALAVGRPTASGLLEGSGWFYVQSRYRHYAWRAPQEIDRQVVAISFDEGGTVTNIERFGQQDGQVVVLSRRVTDTNIRGVSFIRQLLGNIGNIRADQFLGQN